MFQLSEREAKALVSQNVIPSIKHLGGGLPYVFTQEGVSMLSGVLRSRRAVQANIAIMRAFVRIRELIIAHKELVKRLYELERRIEGHDADIHGIVKAIKSLMQPPPEPKSRIGFKP